MPKFGAASKYGRSNTLTDSVAIIIEYDCWLKVRILLESYFRSSEYSYSVINQSQLFRKWELESKSLSSIVAVLETLCR